MKLSVGRLAVTFIVAVTAWLVVQEYGQSRVPHKLHDEMLAAANRTEKAFAVVDSVKRDGGYAFPPDSQLPWRALLGEEYTAMTTTLGSRVAKEVSTNPAWASVMVRLLSGAGVVEGDTVAVLISASFPALGVAALAAVYELGATPLIMSSLGASSYGANVRGSTWLDWESWIRYAGVMNIRSRLVTAGGEQDAALGLPEEGRAWLREAARRNGVEVKRYASLAEAIAARMNLLDTGRLRAVVNIGGGHASMGGCSHAASLPVGLWKDASICDCPDRGVLTRSAQQGVEVIHLLQIRKLASMYGLDFEPGSRYNNADSITTVVQVRPIWILAAISAIIVSIVIPEKRRP
jgi:poly-gamma-glutamate system protein